MFGVDVRAHLCSIVVFFWGMHLSACEERVEAEVKREYRMHARVTGNLAPSGSVAERLAQVCTFAKLVLALYRLAFALGPCRMRTRLMIFGRYREKHNAES